MCTRTHCSLWVLVFCVMGGVSAGADVIWDFEKGNDHGFVLTCVNPATPASDDPTVAGDEAITGVGGPKGLPGAGVAWSIGRPDQYDGMKPAVQEGDKAGPDGTMQYNRAGTNHPFTFPTNGRGQESYLNTYNLTGWGDNLHTAANDQIAKSPLVLLGEGAVLTVWAHGGGSGTTKPALDPNPAAGYTNGSSGVAVISAVDGSLLASVLTNGQGTLRQDTLNLSAFAGQKVRIEVVDAFAGGWGWLAVDEIRITNAVSLGASRQLAAAPNPADGATDVPLEVVLRWEPGEFAPATDGHRVYFSADFRDVNDGFAAVGLTSEPAFDTTDLPFALDFGTVYYWRVDEANSVTGWDKGRVWSFTTEPYAYPLANVTATASSAQSGLGPQNTVNGSGLNAKDEHSADLTHMWMSTGGLPSWIQYEFEKVYKLDELWVWNSNQLIEAFVGFGAKAVSIEYSVDGATWTVLEGVPEFARATGLPTYTPNTVVSFGGVMAKFAKLTIHSNWGGATPQTGLSEVRFFHAPVQAREPQPATGATNVDVETTLTWRRGRGATGHEVYFGTDQAAVAQGAASVGTVAELSFSPGLLDLGTTYFWRVDEIGQDGVYSGDVWSFSTMPYATVDDFENYNDAENAGTRIYETWIDGFGTTTNGSQVGNLQAPFAEKTVIHGGRQSMPLFYDNSGGKTSEATRTFEATQDWTASGVKSLSLWFYGGADNAGQLYLKINNAKVMYNGGAADIKRPQWQPWNVDVTTVSGANKVAKLTIGIEGAGATGTIYIDDIRLYPKTPAMQVPVEPARTGLLAEYLFDNGANDTSGNGHHGTFLGDAHVADSRLVLDGTDDAAFIPRLGGAAATHAQCTYSMWMYSLTKPDVSGIIGGINYDNWAEGGGIHCKLYNGRANVGISGVPGGDLNGTTIVNAEEWIHLGLTVTDTTVTLYLNGQVEASRTYTTPLQMILGRGCIGAYRNNNDIQRELKGQMDDVRIYNRAVSLEEMLWLAGRRDPAHKPF